MRSNEWQNKTSIAIVFGIHLPMCVFVRAPTDWRVEEGVRAEEWSTLLFASIKKTHSFI